MTQEDYRLHLVKTVKYPFEYFKGQKSKLVLEDGTEYKGILLNHEYSTIDFVTNIGTTESPEKVILKISQREIKYIIENNYGVRKHPN